MMEFVPVVLAGQYVRVVPFDEKFVESLAATGDDAMMYYTFGPAEWTPDGIRDYIARRYTGQDNRLPYVITKQDTGEVVGFAAYINISREDRRLEIGPVWIAEEHQGSPAFSEAMYLMLKQAFEVEQAQRVEFTCDSRNVRSRSALLKIGATIEGTKRKDVLRNDKTVRDTVILGIIDTDWPSIARDLHSRLYATRDRRTDRPIVRLRRSRLEDVTAIWEVEKSAFGQGYSQGTIRQFFDLFSDLLYVAETNTAHIVGYVLAGATTSDAITAWILSLAVRRDYQHQGIGTMLMAAIHEQLSVRGRTNVLLTVHPDKASVIALYEKLGYTERELVPNYFDATSPRYVMFRDLLQTGS